MAVLEEYEDSRNASQREYTRCQREGYERSPIQQFQREFRQWRLQWLCDEQALQRAAKRYRMEVN